MWSRNGIVTALLKYSSGFEAGTLFCCLCLLADHGTEGVISIFVAISTAVSYHILLWTSILSRIYTMKLM